ncbi:MAG: hypothetical protein B7Z68_03260 [Acidobacteria bacterium 21-70-11]|nr:MAG: hypothetical protein B7Z68_03260 [Acidobacteria bacterium 21-70-11]OYW02914.1 MAG: hypothetical protein B7Z61_11245 [Acidobacteria bacterium 37-71-11]HQT93161.1 hypothetical protein [Thermoanaerobaculaceae bacterium]HQU33559.1 hypothetical protein [Thermoanaerobaculaceae bacterium]
MNKLKIAGLVLLSLAVTGSAFAGNGQRGTRDRSGPLIATAETVTVEGVVVQFLAGPGSGMPELQVEDAAGVLHTFILGPFWYLTDQGFTAQPGDAVIVTAYSCTLCDTGFAVVSVVNVTAGVTLTLRDANGLPIWPQLQTTQPTAGSGGSGNQGQRSGKTGSVRPVIRSSGGSGTGDHLVPDLDRMTTYTGTVVSTSIVAGAGAGTLVLATSAGDVSFLLSPVFVLIRAGFDPAVGDALTVNAAPVTIDGQEIWLAITITDDASGLVLVLRDPATGLPVGGQRSGR